MQQARTVPGETRLTVEAELAELYETVRGQAPGFEAAAEISLYRSAYEADRQEPVVRALMEAVRRITGAAPEYGASSGWMDSAVMGAAGIPTVIFGPSGGGAHSAVEWVDMSSVVDTAKGLPELAVRFCG